MKRTNEDLMGKLASVCNKNAKKCVGVLAEILPLKYLGVALTVDKESMHWARKAVCELNPQKDESERLWSGRSETVSENGIVPKSGASIVPKCPISLSTSGDYFKFSTMTIRSLLEQVFKVVISQHYSGEDMIEEVLGKASAVSFSCNRYFLHR